MAAVFYAMAFILIVTGFSRLTVDRYECRTAYLPNIESTKILHAKALLLYVDPAGSVCNMSDHSCAGSEATLRLPDFKLRCDSRKFP